MTVQVDTDHYALEAAVEKLNAAADAGLTLDGRRNCHIVLFKCMSDGTAKILGERSIGNPDEWTADFKAIAHGKAKITARTGLPSRVVQLEQRDLLEDDDVEYWGSAIVGAYGAAISGLEPEDDQGHSYALAVDAGIKAEAERRRVNFRP